jgi:hypothetical protein
VRDARDYLALIAIAAFIAAGIWWRAGDETRTAGLVLVSVASVLAAAAVVIEMRRRGHRR